jgi:hypothetical protein
MRALIHASLPCVLASAWWSLGALPAAAAPAGCGEVVTVPTHARTTTRYAFTPAAGGPGQHALVLLPGSGGHVNLDARGCPRALKGNGLIRMLPLFHAEGFATALVDAPSDHWGEDGLAGFRLSSEHMQDLGEVIQSVRARTGGPVWLVGTSRGTLSAVNAAAYLSGPAAPDGLVLSSALMTGAPSARKPWIAHTVFDLPLESLRLPVLLLGHASDHCPRSPAQRMGEVAARMPSEREDVVTVTGGPVEPGLPDSLAACEGRSPHGFVEQEAEVVAGIARFVRGGHY